MNEFLGEIFEYGGTIYELSQEQNNGNYKGVYIIVRTENFQNIEFAEPNLSGWFKGKDPTVSIDKLKSKWVDDADILYIGKSEKNIRKRIKQHIDFWNGEPVAAWGGRIIAQIQNFNNLEVWNLLCDNPKEMERKLLCKFKERYGKLPFANWRL